MTTALAVAQTQPTIERKKVAPLEFTDEQRKMIRDSFLNGATDAEASVLLELARIRGLNPITQQIHFVKRWNSQRRCEVWAAQTGIDGFRSIAERTGLYEGQDEPEYVYNKDGKLSVVKVRVYRKDWSRPAVGIAHFEEYAQKTKEGALTAMWATKPHVMLSKCAEAQAFRRGFPDDTSGLYAPEEMGDEDEREVDTPPSAPQNPQKSTTQAVKDKLKAKIQVVDVAPGQTEEQAKAAQEDEPAPSFPGAYDRCAAYFREMGGQDGKQLARLIKGACAGRTWREVTDEDEDAIKTAIRLALQEPPTANAAP